MLKIHCTPDKTKYLKAYKIYINFFIKFNKSNDSFFIILIGCLSLTSFVFALIFKSEILVGFGCIFFIWILVFHLYYLLKRNRFISTFKKYVNSIPEEDFKKEFELISEENEIKIDSFSHKYDELKCFIRYKEFLFIEKKDHTLFNVIFHKTELQPQTFEQIVNILIKQNIKEIKHKIK